MTRHGYRGSTSKSTTYHRDQSGHSAVPSPVANDGCLSSRADFIPSWLNHMRKDPPQDIPQPKNLLESNDVSWHPNGLTSVRIQPNYGTGRHQSSDIFIQNSPSQSSLPDHRCYHQYRQPAPDSDHGQNLDDGEQHRDSMRLTSTTPQISLTKNHVFEKQPRRKTRRDRYDTIKSKDERVEKRKGKKSSTRVSKKRRMRSSREVMTNFSSQAIANPGAKITLEQNFTPGLFVNGRSSSSLADLAFNDIPLNHENVETYEREHPSHPEPKQRKKRNPRHDEIKTFTDALKRLIADYPPPESTSHSNSTVVPSVTPTRHSNGDNGERPIPRGSHTPRIHTPRSLSVRSHPTAVCSNHNPTQKVQEGPTTEQDPTAVRSRKDHTPSGLDAADSPRYRDKGVMVSPWMHQRARESLSYDIASADYQLRRREAESSISRTEVHVPNPVFEMPGPEVHRQVTEELDFKAKRIENMIHPRDKIPPMSYRDSTSGPYPSHALFPRFGGGLLPFDRIGASEVIDARDRDAYSIEWPAKPTTFQPHQKAFQAANTLSQRTSQVVDDIPGETLKEYIDRMEREILGADKPSARYVDKALFPAEAAALDDIIQPSKPLCEIDYRDRFLQRNRPYELVDIYPKHYPGLSYPEEGPNESEPAFVWQPNHMMWR